MISDVFVIGGGPAGSTAARLLAEWGHSVTLVRKPDGRPNLGQSLPPSIDRLLRHLDIAAVVAGRGFYATAGNTVWWARGEGRSETFGDGLTGLQIESAPFEDLLLDQARHAGVDVRAGTVRGTAFDDGEAVVALEGAEAAEVRCRWVLDCSGRAGVVASQGLRRSTDGPRTVALSRVWDSSKSWDLPDPSHTLVESYDDGWAWSVPVRATRRHVTVMVDPSVTALARDADVGAMYEAELAKAPRIQQIALAGEPAARAFACGASQYSASCTTGDGFLLVGDAASFVDPLSSFGVKKALVSGWMAAVVTNTCLRNEAMRSPALDLYDRREREAYSSLASLSERFYREGADRHDHPFWALRSEADHGVSDATWGAMDVQLLRQDPEVLAAFDALRAAPAIRLRPTGVATLAAGPAVQGREVVFEDQLRSPWTPHGVRFLREVDLPALVRMAPDFSQVPDLYDAYNASNAPVILPDFLGALAVLLAKRIVRNELVD